MIRTRGSDIISEIASFDDRRSQITEIMIPFKLAQNTNWRRGIQIGKKESVLLASLAG